MPYLFYHSFPCSTHFYHFYQLFNSTLLVVSQWKTSPLIFSSSWMFRQWPSSKWLIRISIIASMCFPRWWEIGCEGTPFLWSRGFLSHPWLAQETEFCRLMPLEYLLPGMSGMWTRLSSAFLGRCPSSARMVPMVLEKQCLESACCQIALHLRRHSGRLILLPSCFEIILFKLSYKIPRKRNGKTWKLQGSIWMYSIMLLSDYHLRTKNSSREKTPALLR